MRLLRPIFSFLLLTSSAHLLAAVSVEQLEGGIVKVEASNESNGAILTALSREFAFTTEVGDSAWANARRDFNRSGTLDKLLQSLLSGTNKVLAYQPLPDGAGSRIDAVTVLGQQTAAGNVMFAPVTRPVVEMAPEDDDEADDYLPDDPTHARFRAQRAQPPARDQSVASNRDASDEDEQEAAGQGAQMTVADMIRSRAQPGTATAQAAYATPPTGNGDGPMGVDQAALAALTRQAHQNVKHLAEALRQAEAQAKELD